MQKSPSFKSLTVLPQEQLDALSTVYVSRLKQMQEENLQLKQQISAFQFKDSSILDYQLEISKLNKTTAQAQFIQQKYEQLFIQKEFEIAKKQAIIDGQQQKIAAKDEHIEELNTQIFQLKSDLFNQQNKLLNRLPFQSLDVSEINPLSSDVNFDQLDFQSKEEFDQFILQQQ